MKINSVITMEVKTRKEELDDLLGPDGELNRNVYEAVMKIRHASNEVDLYNCREELDNAINKYV